MELANKRLMRGIFKGFWNIHILHHAAKKSLYGPGVADHLRRRGYGASSAALDPMLKNMERLGWLRIVPPPARSWRKHKDYRLTQAGRRVLNVLAWRVKELHREITLAPTI